MDEFTHLRGSRLSESLREVMLSSLLENVPELQGVERVHHETRTTGSLSNSRRLRVN